MKAKSAWLRLIKALMPYHMSPHLPANLHTSETSILLCVIDYDVANRTT